MKKWWIIGSSVLMVLILAGALFLFINSDKKDFEVNSLLVKSNLRQGDLVSSKILVINDYSSSQDFNVSLVGLDNFGFLSDDSFILESGESKELTLSFDDSKNFSSSVYTGKIVISGEDKMVTVPVVVELETRNIIFATTLDVSPVYDSVLVGDKFSGTIKILNLDGAGKHLVKVNYLIKDLSGKVLSSESEELGIENEVVYTKTMKIPEIVQEGQYVFGVIVEYKDSVGCSTYLFNVIKNEPFEINYIIILIFVFLLAILVLVYFVFKERNNLFMELNSQHREEMGVLFKNIDACKRIELDKTKLDAEREQIKNKYKNILRHEKNELKKKQNVQKKLFKKLQVEHKEDEMKNKLSLWKKQGYNIDSIESKMLNSKDIKKKIDDYKKKGYNVDMFKK